MNIRLASAVALALLCGLGAGSARADLVTNGNFANGFAGWTLAGDITAVSYGQAEGQFTGENGAPLGNSAYLGTLTGSGTLSQTLTTVAGTTYDLTFLLQADFGSAPGTGDYFTTSINGVVDPALSVTNVGPTDWAQYSDVFTATSNSTVLSFAFDNIPSYFELTDVSVPEPATVLFFVGGLAAMFHFRQRWDKGWF